VTRYLYLADKYAVTQPVEDRPANVKPGVKLPPGEKIVAFVTSKNEELWNGRIRTVIIAAVRAVASKELVFNAIELLIR